MTADLPEKNNSVASESVDQTMCRKALSKARYKFGFVNLLYQGEEATMLPIHTVIIRALGGSALHLGICTAVGNVSQLGQWVAPFLLKKYNSNRKAMAVALWGGALFAFLMLIP